MSLLEIILIAIELSMDAFAVSITLGLSIKKPKMVDYLIPGLFFGLFQAIMPYIGYFAGTYFSNKIQNFDHWIAFVILGIIGSKMIKDCFSEGEKNIDEKPFHFIRMLLLAIATSIDALAIGVTCAFLSVNIFITILIIGSITFFTSMSGVKVGNVFGGNLNLKQNLSVDLFF